MDDDIVTRLRKYHDNEYLSYQHVLEAADEIERLRAENQTLKEEKAYWRLMGRELFDTAFPTNKNYTSFIHPDAKGDS